MRCLWVAGLLIAPIAYGQERIEPVQPVSPGSGVNSRAQASMTGTGELALERQFEFRLGPFYVRPGVLARAGVRGVAAASSAESRLVSRVFVDAGPRLAVLLPVGTRHLFSASGEAAYRWTTTSSTIEGASSQQNRWFYEGVAGYQFSGSRVGATATYTAKREETGYLAGLGTDDDVGLTDTLRARSVTSRGPGAGLSVEITRRTTFRVSADKLRQQYEELDSASLPGSGDASELDRDRVRIDAVLDRQVTSRTAIGLFANASQTQGLSDSSRDNDRIRAGIQLSLAGAGAAPLSGQLRLGVEDRAFVDEIRDRFTGPYVYGLLGWRIDRNVTALLHARARTEPTTWANNAYYFETEGRVITDILLSGSFGVYVGASYGTVRFPEPAAIEQPDGSIFASKRLDRRWSAEGGLLLTLFRTPFRLGGGYYERSSNFAVANNTGWFMRISASGNVALRRDI